MSAPPLNGRSHKQ